MGCVKQTSPGFARALAALGAMGAGLAMAEPLQVPPEAFSPTTLTAKPAPQPAANGPLQPAVKPKPAAKPAAAGSAKPAEAKPAAARTAAAPAPLAGPVPLPRPRPPDMSAYAQVNVGLRGALFATRARFKPLARPAAARFAVASTTTTSPADIEQLKRVIEATRKGREADANAAENAIVDPLARKLAEWVILRSDNTSPSFPRYAAFVMANPAWPHVPLFRRRAENALWNDGVPDSAVLAFFANNPPTTAKGRYMLAHALLAKGDRAGAAELVRYAWTRQDASADVESKVLELYGDMLTRADHKMRMEQRFYLDDVEAGMREAKRLGGDEVALAKARAAVIKGLNNAKALLDDVPAAARHDAGYIFALAQWLRKNKKPDEAKNVMLTAPQDPALLVDTNQWWLERRILVRQLLDENNAKAAFLVAANAAPPTQGNWRVDRYFTAGWIALRFLHDAKTAAEQFAHITEGTANPHALSRGGYWQGRAAEAMGKPAEAKDFYERAARHTATYYGQLARARLGLKDLGLIGPPAIPEAERKSLNNLEIVRAAELLYGLNERTMLAAMFAEIGESGADVAGMAALAEVAARYNDPHAMVFLGRFAHARGLPLDYYAYPTFGLPDYKPIAPPIDPAVAYSIVRQESDFDQSEISSANAMGLMQVTPEAGRDTARRFKVAYDGNRLRKDPVYNMQMGAAELSNLLHYYRGSYLLTFAGYNAGMGRVRQWLAAYGDPRDPHVDPIDWAERIPLAETRNYVQRVMENMQVYRARFGGGTKLAIEADLKRGAN
ncbi:MAG TPA: lytic transglycosylase domain-containing protein [Pseudolabrys sp.]|nr:lytic transglycosylase domain-containing protein [Pseudolabrys sp.]